MLFQFSGHFLEKDLFPLFNLEYFNSLSSLVKIQSDIHVSA